MADSHRNCWVEAHENTAVLHLAGVWRLTGLRELSTRLSGLNGALQVAVRERQAVVLGGDALKAIDTAAALLLLSTLEDAGVDIAKLQLRGFEASHARIVEVVRSRQKETVALPTMVVPASRAVSVPSGMSLIASAALSAGPSSPQPPIADSATIGTSTSPTNMMQPWTKSVRLTARNPPNST